MEVAIRDFAKKGAPVMMADNTLEYIRTAHTIHHFFRIGEHYYLWEIRLDPEFEEENKVKMMGIGGWKVLY